LAVEASENPAKAGRLLFRGRGPFHCLIVTDLGGDVD
jgi:hypothetical protein